jgi:YesN/AraC family two-component response regulator
MLRETPNGFDIVVTDLNMPRMDGIQLAARLKEIRPGIPVILTTGYRHYNRYMKDGSIQNTGIDLFLKKPYDKNQLIQSIADCLKKKN